MLQATLASLSLEGVHGTDWKYRYRRQLQVLGQAGREEDPDIWVKLLSREVLSRKYPADCLFIVDDARYRNELISLKSHRFVCIRIEPTEEGWSLRGGRPDDSHPSEVGLDMEDPATWDMILRPGAESPRDIVRQIFLRFATDDQRFLRCSEVI
jgi:hypothetical protein